MRGDVGRGARMRGGTEVRGCAMKRKRVDEVEEGCLKEVL